MEKLDEKRAVKDQANEVGTHQIRKQVAAQHEKTCGVSFVVESESKMKNVEHKYKKLAHVVY